MAPPEEDARPRVTGGSPFAVALDDLEASVRVPLEHQVMEEDTDVPPLPSDAKRRRADVMRVITHGG